MFKKMFTGLAAVLFTSSVFAFASGDEQAKAAHIPSVETPTAVAGFDEEALKAKLSNTLGLVVEYANPTPLAGIVEIVTEQGLFYSSADGNYLLQGKLFGLGETVTNLTEQSMAKIRVNGMDKFEQAMIVYPAKNEKHVVTIFTDITCGYCRKLHKQMDEYNDNGITVRYLAYPRAGITDREGNLTQGYKDLRSVWCHEDPATAMTKAKSGTGIAARICDKPVKEEFDFGRRIGVNSTPSIVLENGMMFPGYREPDALLAMLETL